LPKRIKLLIARQYFKRINDRKKPIKQLNYRAQRVNNKRLLEANKKVKTESAIWVNID